MLYFCLCCYLFKNVYAQGNACDFFTKTGFKTWNHSLERFNLHVGEVNSVHNRCFNKMLDFENQSQSIQVAFNKQSEKTRSEHRIRLEASTNVARFLLEFGLSFRGHDESESSKIKGLFLGLLEWLGKMLPDMNNVILKHAPKNAMMTSPKIQKDIVSSCAQEIVKAIIDDLDGDFFGILIDEYKDISHHEQMTLSLRYVNENGKVNERVIAIVHVGDTSAQSLKETICSLLLRHSLSTSKIRGQGYDGGSNMQGKMNGLKALILKETPSAHCIHYFAHQLQLTLVAVSKKNLLVGNFFAIIANVLNMVGSSFKRRDQLRDHQAERLEQLLESGEVQSGKGLNQERGLQRPGDTLHVLDAIKCGGFNPNDRLQAGAFLNMINEFEFVFLLHLMLKILVMSNELSVALQRNEQDIVNAMIFLDITKKRLQLLRDDRWESLMNEVSLFCDKHEILVPKMDEFYIPGKSKRKFCSVTYSHHLRVELFYAIIDFQLQELNNQFDVVSGNLFLGMASLNSVNAFANFDKKRIMILAKHYPDEFGEPVLRNLSHQLDTFIIHMRCDDPRFSDLKGIGDLAKALVNANLIETYSLVYLLVKLTLILPVATATVERAFSSMKYIKNELRSSISDEFLNDCLVCYIEKDIFINISNDAIIDHFQNMKTCHCQI
ncbi:hypothetical protein R3W88_026864 [Solanum pinnatisectum]|uniref:Zinc finger MYM-type protein 1-like n=1 Tax=Solanum pinnatisectum TaxID=50273 RepID=A0AAV9LHU8_9SOLN|nr:hypothetical protein R3W88_026864 [Solanum pinnatisectum]